MRYVRNGLFAALLLVCAAGAEAQVTVWSATLTPGSVYGDPGCNNDTASRCDDTAVLTNDQFSYGGTTYTFHFIDNGGNNFRLQFVQEDVKEPLGSLTLHVGSREFRISDAEVSGSTTARIFWISDTFLTIGTPVSLSLVDPDATPPPPPPPNDAPEVTASCEPCTVGPGGNVRLTAEATDPDGDTLRYRWRARAGTFTAGARSAVADWRAPDEPGRYPVGVYVDDGTVIVTVTVYVVVTAGPTPTPTPALPLGALAILAGLLTAVGRRSINVPDSPADPA